MLAPLDFLEQGNVKKSKKMLKIVNIEEKLFVFSPKTAVSLKYLSNSWRTLQMLMINYEIYLILTCSAHCVISEGNRVTDFSITDTKLYVPVVTLSTQDNTKLLQQLKSGFKRTINWNIYQSKVTENGNQHLDYLIGPTYQRLNRLFEEYLLFEDNARRTRHTGYFLLKVERKCYNVKYNY